ncbi:hypothetical protein ABIB54_000519 [Frigoribacterium sp. UYMn621]
MILLALVPLLPAAALMATLAIREGNRTNKESESSA